MRSLLPGTRALVALVALFALAVLVVLAVARVAPALRHEERSVWGADYFPNVRLVSQDGREFRFFDDLIRGKVVALSFIYTSCPDACPLETARLAEVQRILGERMGKDVFFCSITIDPKRDTPEVLARYASRYQAGPGWLFLTGKAEDIALLRRKLGLLGNEKEKLRDHGLSLLLGNQATGQWVKRSPFDDAHVLATLLGGWLQGWKDPRPAGRDYAIAPPLRRLALGESLFRTRCAACHALDVRDGAARLGPDLLGIVERRDRAWLARWLEAPDRMLAEKDPIAVALLAQANGVPMPNLQLDPAEVSSLITYLESEGRQVADRLAAASPPVEGSCCRKAEGAVLVSTAGEGGGSPPPVRRAWGAIPLTALEVGSFLALLGTALGCALPRLRARQRISTLG